MAGGQQFSGQQGTLGADLSVGLTGSALAASTGTLLVEALPVNVALTGSAVAGEIGDVALNRFVPLRSRKGGGGATARLLTGLGWTSAQGNVAARPQVALLGRSIATSTGTVSTSRTRALTGILIQIAQTSIGPGGGGGTYDPADILFIQGTAGSSQLPLPSGYNSGGVYGVASGTLPAGVTLSETGLVTYDGTAAAGSSTVSFFYTEPNALPVLTLVPSATGTFPYTATAYPLEGALPSGRFLVSPDDANLRSSTLSTWPDGSAQVVIVAGSAAVTSGVNKQIRLRVNAPTDSAGTTLTTANINAAVSTITVNFSGTPQTLTLASATPDWIWWQNSQAICARYRLSCGLGVMEAIIDIHAFASGKAWVEVVVENGKFNCNLTSAAAPVAQNYVNATIAANGTTFRTVSSPLRGQSFRSPTYLGNVGTQFFGNTSLPEWQVREIRSAPPNPPYTDGWKFAVTTNDSGVSTGLFAGHEGDLATWNAGTGVFDFTEGTVGQITTISPIDLKYFPNPYTWDGSKWLITFYGGHEAFRAFYVAAQIDGATVTDITSSPGVFSIETLHDLAHLQAHPYLFKPIENSTQVMATKYPVSGVNVYAPFTINRQRVPGMGAGGGGEQIGLFTGTQSDYIVTGTREARNALLATDLAGLTLNANWRHDGTGGGAGTMPTRAQLLNKRTSAAGNGSWPGLRREPKWDETGAHTPALAGLSFLCRPSPCFIELAQKQVCQHATNYANSPAMVLWYDEVRGRAWKTRDFAVAIWLTPDADYDGSVARTGITRKNDYRSGLAGNITIHNLFLDKPWNTLQVLYGFGGTAYADIGDPNKAPGAIETFGIFMGAFAVQSFLMTKRMAVLRGTDQDGWSTMCTRYCTWPIRYVNDASPTTGEWRLIMYYPYLGEVSADGKSVDMGVGNFAERARTHAYGEADVPVNDGYVGVDWYASGQAADNWTLGFAADYRNPAVPPDWNGGNDYVYDAQFWAALSDAVEAGLPGADAAWDRWTNHILNFSIWRQGFKTYPIYNRWPRNK